MRFRFTYTALLLGGLGLFAPDRACAQGWGSGQRGGAVASPGRRAKTQDPAEYYLTAYRLCQEAEEQAKQGNYALAVKKSNQAEKVLAVVVRDYPAWKPNMVAARRKLIANNLASYREKAAQAPIPTGRQPGRAVPKEVAFELPGIVTPPSSSIIGEGNEDLSTMAADDQELRATIARLQEECRRMAKAYKELYGRYSETQKQMVAAQLEQKMYKERYEELQKRVTSERAASNSVVESLSRQLAEMDEKYRASEKARKEAEERAAALESQLAETQAELERVTRERDALKAENEQLRAIVELNTPEKTKALLDQNLSLAEQLKTAQQRVAALEGMMAGTDDQNDVLTRQLDEARAEAERLREEMSGVYDENRGYRRRVSELTERLNNLEAELNAKTSQPVVDPALAEENKVLKDVIAKQRRTIEMQEKGRLLLLETYKQLKSANKEMLEELQKLEEESRLDLTDGERRLIESIRAGGMDAGNDSDGSDAVRRSLEIETLASLADKAFSKARYTSAEQLYRTLYDYQPDHVPGLVNLGTILLYRNKCEEAVEYLTRATRLAPELPITYFLAGISYYRLDQMEQAERMFIRTVELDPANAEAFFYLANIEGVSGRFELALKHFAAAVKLKPSLADAHYNMARLYAETSKIPDAARAYDRAIHSGAEPDPEFENYLRNHPDNVLQPGADLVAEIKPDEEAALLLEQDPEAAQLVAAREDGDAPAEGTAAGKAPAPDDAPLPPADDPGNVPADAQVDAQPTPIDPDPAAAQPDAPAQPDDGYTEGQREVLNEIARMSQQQPKEASAPSPAGAGHKTEASRFSTVRVRTRAGGYRHRVKLRLKRPEPQRIRSKGGEIKVLKKKGSRNKR